MGSYYKKNKVVPVTTILLLIGIFWYLVAIPMNSEKVSRQFKNLSTSEHIQKCWSLKKPKLPTPHQIVTEMVNTTFFKKVSSKRSLVYHGWITLQATLAGFLLEISGDFPQQNEIINFGNYNFKVEAVDDRRIKQIKLTILPV